VIANLEIRDLALQALLRGLHRRHWWLLVSSSSSMIVGFMLCFMNRLTKCPLSHRWLSDPQFHVTSVSCFMIKRNVRCMILVCDRSVYNRYRATKWNLYTCSYNIGARAPNTNVVIDNQNVPSKNKLPDICKIT
jgi:hypothetical protein